MNEFNRLLIVLTAAMFIVVMAVVIFLTWAAPNDVIRALGDSVQFLDDNDSLAGQLIVTLGALTVGVLALLMIIAELAPEDEPKELRVEQAGATTVIPADALRLRLEEALLALPEVTAARTRVHTRDGGIASNLELTVTPNANLAEVTQAATRVVVDAVQKDLGLPVAGVPSVKFTFGGSKGAVAAPPADAGIAPVPLEPSPSVLAPIDPPVAAPSDPPAAESYAWTAPSSGTAPDDPPAAGTYPMSTPVPDETPRDDSPGA